MPHTDAQLIVRCAACRLVECDHNDMEFAGLVPVSTRTPPASGQPASVSHTPRAEAGTDHLSFHAATANTGEA